MIERLIILESGRIENAWVEETVSLLAGSAVVVHPTETVHGLGCRYDSSPALERISRLKGRDPGKPMIFLLPGSAWLENLCGEIPRLSRKLVGLYWPGPLTLVLRTAASARSRVPWLGETVAVRQCGHPFTARVLAELDLPIASTSLNLSGQPAPGDPLQSLEILKTRWESEPCLRPELAVIDRMGSTGKNSNKELPSTILAVEPNSAVRVIRRGACSLSEIFSKAGIDPAAVEYL